ncbi:MAG: phosphotransferase [bacterium]|nr:phosphotransferase [bacterium]
MLDTHTIDQIIHQIEGLLGITIVERELSDLQGTDGHVFIVTDKDGTEYVIKYSPNAINDVVALNLIKEKNLTIPVPKLFGYFSFKGKTVVVLEKITFPLLDQTSRERYHLYIKSMIDHLQKIHTVKSKIAGFVSNQEKRMSWQQFLLNMYTEKSPFFDWREIVSRDGVDTKLVQKALTAVVKKIENQKFLDPTYSLLHTDFNQKNLFVDQKLHAISSITDWSEAMFGDPLYDFVRIRLYIFHFNLKHGSRKTYFDLLHLTKEEKEREELYFVIQILNYIGWYSEVKNDFNTSRLAMHQEFLKNYPW